MQVSAPLALGMLNDMTGLQRLNLQSFGDLNDAHLTQIASRLPSLQQLKVLMSPPPMLDESLPTILLASWGMHQCKLD